jgi:hypothetical protein
MRGGWAIASLLAAAAAAQAPAVERSAPRERVELEVAGARLAVEYGRPARAGRPVFGTLVPYGRLWRTGADEATVLKTDADLLVAGLAVPAGRYALFTIPGEEWWTLVVSRVADQWGAYGYERAQDLGRARVRPQLLAAPVEQLTLTLAAAGERSALLSLEWETTRVSVPIELAAAVEAVPEEPEGAAPPSPPTPRRRAAGT